VDEEGARGGSSELGPRRARGDGGAALRANEVALRSGPGRAHKDGAGGAQRKRGSDLGLEGDGGALGADEKAPDGGKSELGVRLAPGRCEAASRGNEVALRVGAPRADHDRPRGGLQRQRRPKPSRLRGDGRPLGAHKQGADSPGSEGQRRAGLDLCLGGGALAAVEEKADGG